MGIDEDLSDEGKEKVAASSLAGWNHADIVQAIDHSPGAVWNYPNPSQNFENMHCNSDRNKKVIPWKERLIQKGTYEGLTLTRNNKISFNLIISRETLRLLLPKIGRFGLLKENIGSLFTEN